MVFAVWCEHPVHVSPQRQRKRQLPQNKNFVNLNKWLNGFLAHAPMLMNNQQKVIKVSMKRTLVAQQQEEEQQCVDKLTKEQDLHADVDTLAQSSSPCVATHKDLCQTDA